MEELKLVLLLGQLVQENKFGCMTIGPMLDSLIIGKKYSCFSVRTECLTSKNIKHFTVEVNWCCPCFAAGEN